MGMLFASAYPIGFPQYVKEGIDMRTVMMIGSEALVNVEFYSTDVVDNFIHSRILLNASS